MSENESLKTHVNHTFIVHLWPNLWLNRHICKSKEGALGAQNECFRTFCKYFEKCISITYCFHCLSITLKLVSFCIFRSRLIKKSNTLEDEKSISSIFKALEIGVLNLIGFQDGYEPRGENIGVLCVLLLDLLKFTSCKIVRLSALLNTDCFWKFNPVFACIQKYVPFLVL